MASRRSHVANMVDGFKISLCSNYTSSRGQDKSPKLPPLPVPPLERTLIKYIRSVKPFLSKEEFERTQNITEHFLQNEGKSLQELLEKRAAVMENWLEDWWLRVAYLGNRNPLVSFSNPGQIWNLKPFTCEEDRLQYTATLIYNALAFNQIIERNEVPQEMSGNDFLDMSQIYNIFGTSRIPLANEDAIDFKNVSSKPNHIIVMANNNVFSLTVLDKNRRIVPIEEIYSMLLDVIVEARHDGVPVGILTSEHRDSWARMYTLLCRNKQNLSSIQEIERSLFVVCLDKPLSSRCLRNRETHASKLVVHGSGFSQGNASNRWYDKCLQFIVGAGADGVGLTVEHTPADGVPVAILAIYLLDRLENFPPVTSAANGYTKPKMLSFETTPEIESGINAAALHLDMLAEDLDLFSFTFEKFGKNEIKALKTSPDSFVQVAIQYAFYKVHKKPAAQYESASLRKFSRGRTDVIRSCTPEVLAFCEENSSTQKKLKCLQEAVAAHREYVNDATSFNGIDRHLMGLYLIAKENGLPVPQFFLDRGYCASSHYQLSTSNGSIDHDISTAYSPLVHDGYACCYNIRGNTINFGTSAWKSNPTTDLIKFQASLVDALCEMREILASTEKSKL